MHERSLVRALLRQVADLAREHPGGQVQQVRVRIGEFSGVEPELLAMAYDELVQRTALQESTLAIERVPLTAACVDCKNEFQIERFNFQCDKCGSSRLSIQGDEMLLESVVIGEVEP
jgi:hydrogenase nickel incorporation protein HypA/HybF